MCTLKGRLYSLSRLSGGELIAGTAMVTQESLSRLSGGECELLAPIFGGFSLSRLSGGEWCSMPETIDIFSLSRLSGGELLQGEAMRQADSLSLIEASSLQDAQPHDARGVTQNGFDGHRNHSA